MPFFGIDWKTGPVKPWKSKAQRRREKISGTSRQRIEAPPKPLHMLDFDFPPDVGKLQKQDATLRLWFEKERERERVNDCKGLGYFSTLGPGVLSYPSVLQVKQTSKMTPLNLDGSAGPRLVSVIHGF